ncbi:unnamed protein product [Toxocara canis]|uniref:CBF domain-containing protein n=1 Tax=Toxocara canis TaxID=6265 RepID=A0A183V4M8_TOXCA|nr:unnamed protein product [Toxocara canis]
MMRSACSTLFFEGGISISVPLVKHSEGEKWYEYASAERIEGDTKNADIFEIEKKADFLFRRDVDLHDQLERNRAGSEAAWLRTVVVQGTAADKTSAKEVLVHRSPVHALSHLTMLVSIIEKKNTREAYSLLGVLKELFINELLPPNRKLIPFSMRPIAKLNILSAGSQQNMERRLILWKFESDLKRVFETFVNAVERLADGTVENVCAEACRTALDLLAERPEQEQRLLSLLVNKLGHPNRKLASRLIGYLVRLSLRQPKMRSIIVNEVERLIYRKNVSYRAQLYAVSFLAQMQLRAGEVDLATSLLNIYIGLFRMLVAKQKMDEKMLSALLTATNRAFPEGVSDRFYAALYRRLLDVENSAAQESQLFGLLLKTLKNDSVDQRVTAFIKRLLQLSLNRSSAFAAAALVLVSKLLEDRPSLLLLSKKVDKMTDANSVKMEAIDVRDDDEEERYFDMPDSDITAVNNTDSIEEKPDVKHQSAWGWIHKHNIKLGGRSRQVGAPSVKQGE